VPAIFYFKKHSTKYYWKHFSGYCNYQFFTSWVYGYAEAHQWAFKKRSTGSAGYLRKPDHIKRKFVDQIKVTGQQRKTKKAVDLKGTVGNN
jgi:hypothetical protein